MSRKELIERSSVRPRTATISQVRVSPAASFAPSSILQDPPKGSQVRVSPAVSVAPTSSTPQGTPQGSGVGLTAEHEGARCVCCGKPAEQKTQKPTGPQVTPEEELSVLSWRGLQVNVATLQQALTASETLIGFAAMALIEVQLNPGTIVPKWLLVVFAGSTTLLVGFHVLALASGTQLLPPLLAVQRMRSAGPCHGAPPQVNSLRHLVQLTWVSAVLLGFLLFLIEVVMLAWLKFGDYSVSAAAAATGIMVVALFVFVGLTVYYYRTAVDHTCHDTEQTLRELEGRLKNSLQ